MAKKYTDKQKAAYYKKKYAQASAMGPRRLSGHGKYRIGRQYVRGRGAYRVPRDFFSAPKVGSALGQYLGNAIAPGIGGNVGGALGNLGGSLFRQITGWGDYTVKENSLVYPDKIVPSFGDDSIRVKKREYIMDINATSAFNNNHLPVNPGLSDTFPWLSSIANNYEQYRWNGLVFQFVSTSSDAIASTTDLGLGQVVLASDYNSADAPFVNLPQMLGTMFSNSGKPSENIMHAIECAPTDTASKLYYVRSGDIPEGTDIRLYDMLSFQLATQNMPSDYTGMGQLWVSYDITLCKSIQNNQLGFDLNTDLYRMTAPTDSEVLATATIQEHSNLGTTIESGTTIVFPPAISSGYYLINYSVVGNSTALVTPALTPTNCTFISFPWGAGSVQTNSATTSIRFILNGIVRIDDRDAKIAFGTATLPASPTAGNLLITQVNGELFT